MDEQVVLKSTKGLGISLYQMQATTTECMKFRAGHWVPFLDVDEAASGQPIKIPALAG